MKKHLVLIVLSLILLSFSCADLPEDVPDDPNSFDTAYIGVLFEGTVTSATIDGISVLEYELYFLDIGNHNFSCNSDSGIYNTTLYIDWDDSVIIFDDNSITLQ